MTVDYTRRAVVDIFDIADYYERNGALGLGRFVAVRIDDVIARIVAWPDSGKLVMRERGIRSVPLVRYPYVIFYEVAGPGTIRIVHIRHTSRRPWTGN
jgi:toxin ParE1/3/4